MESIPTRIENKCEMHRIRVNRLLRTAMARSGYNTIRSLYSEFGIYNECTFYKKFKDQNWTLNDLCRLSTLLHLTQEERAAMLEE